jgi:hypothetical protein
MYHLRMSKINHFRKIIKQKKKQLITAGYSLSTIHSWIYTQRLPRFETAVEISPIIGMKINNIPYFKTERG